MEKINEKIFDGIQIENRHYGVYDFTIAVLRKIGVDKILDEMLFKNKGQDPDIPYSIIGLIFIANLICAQQPLYKISDFFSERGEFDFVGTFGCEIDVPKLMDDRFAYFLDRLHEVGIRKLFSRIDMHSVKNFGINPGDINIDTTSKVMWGEYEEEKAGNNPGAEFKVLYGHSKQKRPDKKQIKIGMTTGDNVVLDAQVLSGNHDDKTYCLDRIAELNEACEELKSFLGFDGFLIADSAAGSEVCFQAANSNGVRLLTRISDSFLASKNISREFLANLEQGRKVILETSKKSQPSEYKIFEGVGNHKGVKLNLCEVYSEQLLAKKSVTVEKQTLKENQKIQKLAESENKKKPYAWLKDAEEAVKRAEKSIGKPAYLDVSVTISEISVQKKGRPRKDNSEPAMRTKFQVGVTVTPKEGAQELKESKVDRECVFVLATNDFNITGEEMLRKYKTQNQVEVRFHQFKSRHFLNVIFLKKTERIEVLMYLYLIGLQACTVVEHVVRKGLVEDGTSITEISTRLKKEKSNFCTIFEVFRLAMRQIRSYEGQKRDTGQET